MKNLQLEIIDGEQARHGNISTSLQESNDMDKREALLRGLPHNVYMRTMLLRCDSLDEAYRQAVNLTREMELINDRQRPTLHSQEQTTQDQRSQDRRIQDRRIRDQTILTTHRMLCLRLRDAWERIPAVAKASHAGVLRVEFLLILAML